MESMEVTASNEGLRGTTASRMGYKRSSEYVVLLETGFSNRKRLQRMQPDLVVSSTASDVEAGQVYSS